MNRFTFVIVIFAFSALSHASSINSRFPGFEKGNVGYGFSLGAPTLIRYHKWMDWRHASSYSLGYEQNGSMIMGSWSYIFYQLSEDDRWRGDGYVGTIMYGFQLGITGGIHVGDKGEDGRLGIEGGIVFEYLVPDTSYSLRFELLPVLYIAGRETAGVHGGFGITFYMDNHGKAQAFNRSYIRDSKRDVDDFEEEFSESDLEEAFDDSKKVKRRRKIMKKKKNRRRVKKRRKKRRKPLEDDDGELDI